MATRLSFEQETVLTRAADGAPVYVESYNFISGAEGRTFYGSGFMNTFRSLVKRGLLTDDGRAGYVITAAGLDTLRGSGLI